MLLLVVAVIVPILCFSLRLQILVTQSGWFFLCSSDSSLHHMKGICILHHYLLKPLGELMLFSPLLVFLLFFLAIGYKLQEGSSEVAALIKLAFLTIDALCIIKLLKTGHHLELLQLFFNKSRNKPVVIDATNSII
ncbi:hypothetical protein RIF29_39365 [Crotalaria pallida]|uniref:Uncharacterized protein n=1 Tax=Crotalaria pallida TaxID=3830 RepID=A0AAN9E2R3_CROPI